MTLPDVPTELTCTICGTASMQEGLASTNAFGSPDLDMRPPEMKRSTMEYWLQVCPGCGYSVANIAEEIGIPKAFIDSAPYQKQRNNPDYPPLANAFLCKSMIEETQRALSAGAWSAIYAAWVCDDHERAQAAITCRRRALSLRGLGLPSGQKLSDDDEDDIAVTTDLLRRVEDYETVDQLLSEHLGSISRETIQAVLRFQQSLASNRDPGCYTIEEALARN